MFNSNTLQCEVVKPVLPNVDSFDLRSEEPLTAEVEMQLQREFNDTIETEIRLYNKELLNFIDAELASKDCDEIIELL